MVEVSLTVGKLDASLALLLTKDHHLIEFPTILLPDGISAGSVVTIKCEKDSEQEKQDTLEFERVQSCILELYGTKEPIAPVLKVKNITQTSIILEWDNLEIGSSTIKSLTLFKNDVKLGHIPKPLITKTTKLSGLAIDREYEFYLQLETTAGIYKSNKLDLKTHKMTDLSGITVCIGELEDGISIEQIEDSLKVIGAKDIQTEVKVDTTHFITTKSIGDQWKKAIDNNIPVVRPEWLKACELERRIVGVRDFYLDADPKFLEQHRFNKETPVNAPNTASTEITESAETDANPVEKEAVPVTEDSTATTVDPVVEVQEELEEININDTNENLPETVPDSEVVESVAEKIEEPIEKIEESVAALEEPVVENGSPKEELESQPEQEVEAQPEQEEEAKEEEVKEEEVKEVKEEAEQLVEETKEISKEQVEETKEEAPVPEEKLEAVLVPETTDQASVELEEEAGGEDVEGETEAAADDNVVTGNSDKKSKKKKKTKGKKK